MLQALNFPESGIVSENRNSDTDQVKNILKSSRYRKYIKSIKITRKKGLVIEQEKIDLTGIKSLGKNLIFTSRQNAETSWVVRQYKEKDIIEKGFQTLKDPDLIRIRPLRHWTDTKIRAYIFCCVMSFLVIKLMQYKMKKAEIQMSLKLLKEELSDLNEIVIVYKDRTAERKISERSTVQQKLFDLFNLKEIEKMVMHTP